MSTNDEAKYKVIFEGRITEGTDIATVKESLLPFFNNQQSLIEQLFLKQRTILKKGLSKLEAIKYKLAFEKTGAKCVIKQMINKKSPKPVKKPEISQITSKKKQNSQISPKNDNINNLINNTKVLVRVISLYQKLIWVLLIASIFSFGLLINFYFGINKFDINQTTHKLLAKRCNYKIDFTSKKDAKKYTATGLSIFESLGRWSNGNFVRLNFKLPKTECQYSKITFSVIAFNAKKVPVQSANITLNGVQYGEMKIESEQQQLRKFTFGVPTALLKQDGTNIMKFKINFPTSPKSIGQSEDRRMLGFSFRSITFQ